MFLSLGVINIVHGSFENEQFLCAPRKSEIFLYDQLEHSERNSIAPWRKTLNGSWKGIEICCIFVLLTRSLMRKVIKTAKWLL